MGGYLRVHETGLDHNMHCVCSYECFDCMCVIVCYKLHELYVVGCVWEIETLRLRNVTLGVLETNGWFRILGLLLVDMCANSWTQK